MNSVVDKLKEYAEMLKRHTRKVNRALDVRGINALHRKRYKSGGCK